MTGRTGESRARNTELPMLRAYRLWFEHTKRCADCKGRPKAQDGCETGRELWGAYRLVRIGRTP
ncbi:hypothetical protein F9278_25550 [Streptomyces phaeolivaceus]|uniref:Uncharacterized protein n=1 Tax=Streptomyces phaeolivaceus TaxID=2653200 RepID=A0A5P8K768_9ACTN|nr:hypothetical protein [Streptomyces phaeolivaceus]QFQ98961.1 hypothetical protein F9278_25550 [Streptomyces phaeolivaceus]